MTAITAVNDDDWRRERRRMHTGITWHVIHVCIRGLHLDPRMHKGIFAVPFACHVIPVCIRGSRCNPRMHTGIDLDPRMHTGICLIPVCIRGSDGH